MLITFSTSAEAQLLLERLFRLIEQTRILDGDDGLTGEVLHQFDLFIGERSNFLTVDNDGPASSSFLNMGTTMCALRARKPGRQASPNFRC